MSIVRKIIPSCLVLILGALTAGCPSSGGGNADTVSDGNVRTSGDRLNTRKITDSPMHAAAERNDDETIKRLIAEGGNANVALKNGRTPLHIAAAGGQLRAATALLAGGANPAAMDDSGETPLMMASSRGYETLVREMLAKRPDVNAQTRKTGYTALHYACDRSQNPNIVRMLIAAGADKNLRDKKGRTAEDVAMVKNNQAVLDALAGRGAAPAPAMAPTNAPAQNPMGNMGSGTNSTGTNGTPR